MRNPYIVGDPVMGQDFYGREAIIETICERRDKAVHVMGMRRIGKTSLLRQLESQLPGIFVDFQAAVGRADLTRQVQRGLRRLSRRLPWLPPPDEGKSAFELLEDADERAEAEGHLYISVAPAPGLGRTPARPPPWPRGPPLPAPAAPPAPADGRRAPGPPGCVLRR